MAEFGYSRQSRGSGWTVAGMQLDDTNAVRLDQPDAGSIECHAVGVFLNCEGENT